MLSCASPKKLLRMTNVQTMWTGFAAFPDIQNTEGSAPGLLMVSSKDEVPGFPQQDLSEGKSTQVL